MLVCTYIVFACVIKLTCMYMYIYIVIMYMYYPGWKGARDLARAALFRGTPRDRGISRLFSRDA